MGLVFGMHGVVAGARRDLHVHRSMWDRDKFCSALQARQHPFVGLIEALNGSPEMEALTVDDATCASGEAARLAREAGHEVTLFINPYHVESGIPYFFCMLNALMDAAPAATLNYEGRRLDLRSPWDKLRLRKAVKARLRELGTEEERATLLDELRMQLGCNELELPDYLRPLSKSEVRTLQAQGVAIENHGWTHAEMKELSIERQIEEISRGRDWLKQELGVVSVAYAAPFGEADPDPSILATMTEVWLLEDAHRAVGPVGSRIYNRPEFQSHTFLNSRLT